MSKLPSQLLDPDAEALRNYIVHEHLGSGAMGDAFRVTDKRNNRTYVLKQMSLRNMTDFDKLQAQKEILVMDGVDHPNVVSFRESFAAEESVNIIMEYCECGTLEQLIERQRYEGKPFPEDVLIEWMAELLCALAHIHSRRILHRDIKTGNVFVTAKNHLKLGDFGVCTLLTNANGVTSESMIGTPLYFSPEVCNNESYDERSDVWSLGIVFYEMCTLRRPFEADNLFVLIQQILKEPVKPFNTGIKPQFEGLVQLMLSKDPAKRPTAQSLIDEHLEVPTSHPSHPSQKPARSRLIQQYYGPELVYEKPWPPPEGTDLSDSSLFNPRESSTASGTRQTGKEQHKVASGTPAGSGPATTGGAEKATSSTVPKSAPAPGRAAPGKAPTRTTQPAKTGSTPVGTPAETPNSPSKISSPRDRTNLGATDPPRGKVPERRPASAVAGGRAEVPKQRASAPSEFSGPSSPTPTAGESRGLTPDSAQLQHPDAAARRRSVTDVFNSSQATVSSPSCFLDDIATVLERYKMSGSTVSLEQLDDAVSLLNQYKATVYGFC